VKYKVDFTPQALEDISKLDRTVIERVTKKSKIKLRGVQK